MKPVLAIILFTMSVGSAIAQSDVTLSPDGRFVLVQKNVGTERWAIVRDQQDRAVTGNIFNPGGGAQFVWCDNVGGETYECIGNSGCDHEPCQWEAIATVQIPESFFALRGGPVQTPVPTARPTPKPTPKPTSKPTPSPATGLQGLIGTWQFTYSIGSSPFADTIRLQRLQTTQGVNFVVGLNQFGRTVVGGALDDVFETTTLTTDWAVIAFGSIICEAYAFDRNGDSASGKYLLASIDANGDCGGFHGGYTLRGTRTSHSASASSERTDTLAIKKAERRSQRARRVEARESRASLSAEDRGLEASVGRLAKRLRSEMAGMSH